MTGSAKRTMVCCDRCPTPRGTADADSWSLPTRPAAVLVAGHPCLSLAHDNEERPNHALSCGHHPRRVAYPTLPVRPALPTEVAPDRWLQTVDGQRFVRTVRHHDTVTIGVEGL